MNELTEIIYDYSNGLATDEDVESVVDGLIAKAKSELGKKIIDDLVELVRYEARSLGEVHGSISGDLLIREQVLDILRRK